MYFSESIEVLVATLSAVGYFKAVTSLIATVTLGVLFYRITFHPLANVPGPRLWAMSRLPFSYNLLRGRLPYRIHEIHLKYGPIVRLAPTEVSFITESAFKDIYTKPHGKPELRKEPTQWVPLIEGAPGIVFEENDFQHARIRRNFESSFTETALRSHEVTIIDYTNLFVTRLHENCDKPVNIIDWFSFTLHDIMGALVFGESFGSLETGKKSDWIGSLIVFTGCTIANGMFQRFWPFHKILKFMIPRHFRKISNMHDFHTKEKLDRRLAKDDPMPDMISPLFSKLDTPLGISTAELESTTRQLVIGASDTSVHTMAASIYYMLKDPKTHHKLVDEVRTAFPSNEGITKNGVAALPYLNAVLNESLRLMPGLPGNIRRLTPPEGCVISDLFVPGNSIVCFDLYAGGRSASLFHRPNDFCPDRYLPNPPDQFKDDKRKAYQPFTVGPRGCIGQKLAYLEMCMAMANLIWAFDITLKKESEGWANGLLVFGLWEKRPLMLELTPVIR